jgi:dsDNA-specific endonuclease/ATPase MutS2
MISPGSLAGNNSRSDSIFQKMIDDDEDLDGEQAWDAGQPVQIPIDDFIDLHHFRPSEVPELVRDYLEEARARGFAEVRIIHGKGSGSLRQTVRTILERSEHVIEFSDADAARANWGATVARLKPRE